MFLFDLHIHTQEVSPCGELPAADIVRQYHARGYSGIVITDHFRRKTMQRLPGESWPEKVDGYLRGYELAKEAGDALGLTVLLGLESRTADFDCNDFLIYGITRDFLLEHEWLYDRPLAEISAIVRGAGGMIYQAHPLRRGMKVAPPELVDGIEVFNGRNNNFTTDIAVHTARERGWHMLSGSDCHSTEEACRGGVLFEERPETSEQLLQALRADRYAWIARPERA